MSKEQLILRSILTHNQSASSQPISLFHFHIILTSINFSRAVSPIQFVPTNILYWFLIFPMRATCNVSFILLNFDNAMISAEECTLWLCSLRNFLHSVALVCVWISLPCYSCKIPNHYKIYLLPFAIPREHDNRLTWPWHSNIMAAQSRHALRLTPSRLPTKYWLHFQAFCYSTSKVISWSLCFDAISTSENTGCCLHQSET